MTAKTTELARTDGAALAPARDDAGVLLETIMRAAKDESVSVDKLERLFELHQKMVADQARTAFKAALARLQESLPRITKQGHAIVKDKQTGALVRDTPYARYEDIDAAVRPLCSAEGFAFTFDSKTVQGATTFSCTMSHREGHSETLSLNLPSDTSGNKNPIQGMGSAVSYARRYLLSMHLNLITVDEDDDGAGGSGPVTHEQAVAIREHLEAAGGDAKRFLRFMGAESFEAILARDYTRAMAFIDEKKRSSGK